MVLEIFSVLKYAHGEIHNNAVEMKKIIADSNYYGFVIERYIHLFIVNCEYCKREKVNKFPKREDYYYNIYTRMNEIENDRLNYE
jgi:hypothetical protein